MGSRLSQSVCGPGMAKQGTSFTSVAPCVTCMTFAPSTRIHADANWWTTFPSSADRTGSAGSIQAENRGASIPVDGWEHRRPATAQASQGRVEPGSPSFTRPPQAEAIFEGSRERSGARRPRWWVARVAQVGGWRKVGRLHGSTISPQSSKKRAAPPERATPNQRHVRMRRAPVPGGSTPLGLPVLFAPSHRFH